MNSDKIIKEIEDYLVPRLKLDLGEARAAAEPER